MLMKIKLFSFLVVLVGGLFLLPIATFAHPGRTDSSGCHTCRTNCPDWGLSYNEYHCHNSKALPQPKEPIRSHYGEGGAGTTEPWPEYKNQSTPTPSPVSVPKTSSSESGITAQSITQTLSRGMQNSQVSKLQQILAKDSSVYPEGLITGYFGLATERAVKRFQKKHGLQQIGSVGPQTRKLLNVQ